jgi:hypothetical protein
MAENFSVIFKHIEQLSREEPGIQLTGDELKEFEEIRVLREIVLEIQTPEQNYFTST